jgi:hypothetical protein
MTEVLRDGGSACGFDRLLRMSGHILDPAHPEAGLRLSKARFEGRWQ